MKSLFVALFLILLIADTHAQSVCDEEKQEVDRLNSILKNNAREWTREQHRKAKEIFLLCLRESKRTHTTIAKPTTGEQASVVIKNSAQSKTSRSENSVRFATNITTTPYANFKGKKLEAWNAYYKDPSECVNNKGKMSLFVACSKLRKGHLETFNSRWDEATQTLSPLLHQN